MTKDVLLQNHAAETVIGGAFLFFGPLAAIPAHQSNRTHDRLRRLIVALNAIPEQLDAASGQVFQATVYATQRDGGGQCTVNVIETDDFEIGNIELT